MRQNRNFKVPPIKWVDLIEEHDLTLARVRMLWRRGGGEYRPMVPSEVLADQAEETGNWDALELEDTHFEWIAEGDDAPSERRERISATVASLWSVATRWTASLGSWCDFQLLGFSADDRLLFTDGKRCSVRSSAEPDESEPANSDDPGERWSHRRDSDRSRMDNRVNDFMDRMSVERDKSFVTARESLATAQQAFAAVQESIDAAPQLLSKASEVLKEAIDYQSEQNRQIRDQSSGRFQMRAHAFSEMEHSRRVGMTMDFMKFAWESGIANLLPFANRVVEVFGNRNITVFPEFKVAQQAMGYLVLDLTPHQLRQLWGDKDRAAAAMIGLLDQGAGMPNEREALEHIADLVRVLRSEKFRDIATPEQQLAARFIIGRLAMYRMDGFDNGQETA